MLKLRTSDVRSAGVGRSRNVELWKLPIHQSNQFCQQSHTHSARGFAAVFLSSLDADAKCDCNRFVRFALINQIDYSAFSSGQCLQIQATGRNRFGKS